MVHLYRKKVPLIILIAAIIISNVALFLLLRAFFLGNKTLQVTEDNLFLLNKSAVQESRDVDIKLASLSDALNESVRSYKDSFILYFEYLPSGVTIGINEDTGFSPGSFLKVPVVMAYYVKKEREGIKDDKTVKVKESELDNRFGTLYKKGAGYEIRLEDAVSLSLVESDNTANNVLMNAISIDDFNYVYRNLDIPPIYESDNPVITTVQASAVFKSLYFSNITNDENSQKILEILTKTEFKDMLPAGVPAGLRVAHKIGYADNDLYADCGIVYVPNRPYTLCMVSKADLKTSRERMSSISAMIYEYVVKK